MMAAYNTTDNYHLRWTGAETMFLGLYCTLVTVLGILGNSTVIYSSIRYNSIKLDRISLLFVQHLAVADILTVIIVVIPISTTFIAGKYVLGSGYCFLSAHFVFYPGAVNSLVVLSISAYRARMITSPLTSVSKTTALMLIAVIWVVGCVGTVISLAFGSSAVFDPVSVACTSDIYTVGGVATLCFSVLVGIIVFLPLLAVTILNSVQIVIAFKNASRYDQFPNFWGLVTVCSLSGLYLISWVPFIVYTVFQSIGLPSHPVLRLMAFYCNFLNTFGNPILYTFTNRRFGKYVKGLICSVLCCRFANKSGSRGRNNFKMTRSSQPADT